MEETIQNIIISILGRGTIIHIIIIMIIAFILPFTIFFGIISICNRLKKINENIVNLINIEIENQNIMLAKTTQNNE